MLKVKIQPPTHDTLQSQGDVGLEELLMGLAGFG